MAAFVVVHGRVGSNAAERTARLSRCSKDNARRVRQRRALPVTAREVSGAQTQPKSDELEGEVQRRRNLAIISHPDSGKTTMTEKLLLYGGAIQQAGTVRARRNSQKLATSDWMSLEKERGISITSTVLTFEYQSNQVVILDTPGHQDFSEDTYRVLSAADNVLMLVDAAKGLETQTRKLFEVCQMRKLPTATFINKMDRPARSPFEICDQIESEFELPTFPMVWPIGDGDQFRGVYDRRSATVNLFDRKGKGAKKLEAEQIALGEDGGHERLKETIGPVLYEQLVEDIEILDECYGTEFATDEFLRGELTPVFFGSAFTNFGVELFLRRFLEMGRPPPPRESSAGLISPSRGDFSGFVFKLQANLDPKHRDRLAYIRIVSGKFQKGMKVSHHRLPGKQITLAQAQRLFASDRESIEEAYPGDVVGVNNPGVFSIGDTIFTGSEKLSFPGIPSFSPEMFAYIRNPNPSAYKNFRKGLTQLLDEGAVQLLRAREDQGNEDPILAAVGQLQFDVVQRRLEDEYNVKSSLDILSFSVARWVTGPGEPWEAVEKCGRLFNVFYAKDRWERPVLLFKNDWNLNNLREEHPDLELAPWSFAPSHE
mmetsp:Transcript_22556/g.55107  ORF Transcript_22556/g.55107 Transcript_22556/m.55107 type:complete len:599 (+) Transcript_22556:100-1896(+)